MGKLWERWTNFDFSDALKDDKDTDNDEKESNEDEENE